MDVTVSIVIPVRRAQATIESTLESAIAQAREASGEVVAAIWKDDPCFKIVNSIAKREPVLRLVISEQGSGVPQLRRDGVRAARGRYIVLTEDHCLFPAGWLDGFAGSESEVRGGGVSNGRETYAGWAQYFTRYSAFLPPVVKGPTRHLPGNSACYPRGVFNTASIAEGLWEAEFNRELLDRGVKFFMDPALSVVQRQERGWLEFAALRYEHGRCYGGRRAGSKLGLVVRSPLIPVVLLVRNIRAVAKKRYHLGWFALTMPLLACYVLAWSVGEVSGYIFGLGDSCRKTD